MFLFSSLWGFLLLRFLGFWSYHGGRSCGVLALAAAFVFVLWGARTTFFDSVSFVVCGGVYFASGV